MPLVLFVPFVFKAPFAGNDSLLGVFPYSLDREPLIVTDHRSKISFGPTTSPPGGSFGSPNIFARELALSLQG